MKVTCSSRVGSAGIAPALGFVLAAALGCASTQRFSLECVPQDVEVYVDKEAVEGRPPDLSLRVDEAHTVYFKGGGYRPQMVVLESRDVDGEVQLAPQDLCREVVFVPMERQIHMAVDPEEAPVER